MPATRFAAALASAAILVAATGSVVAAQTTPAPTVAPVVGPTAAPAGQLALDARSLRARRTPTGYTLTGQALAKDACQAARFDQFLGNIFPPLFNLNQFRRPGTMGMLCIQRLTWVTAQPNAVTSAAPPRYVTVHTRKASVRVPVR
jgi:hypothetical protein